MPATERHGRKHGVPTISVSDLSGLSCRLFGKYHRETCIQRERTAQMLSCQHAWQGGYKGYAE